MQAACLFTNARGTVIEITRVRKIASTPTAIFATLADPANLAKLLPRVRSVDVLERSSDHARIATHMEFGPFGTIRNVGEVRWQADQEITFVSRSPVFVQSRWLLEPNGAATDVIATMQLDLAPLIGPFAAFVPAQQVITMIAPELDAALAALAQRVGG